MTSDGISDEDWDTVKEVSANVCNVVDDDQNSGLYDAERVRMLYVLAKLTEKYGELPSILATKADYIDDPAERLALFHRALELAQARKDIHNEFFIVESLRDFYRDDEPDPTKAEYWANHLLQVCP